MPLIQLDISDFRNIASASLRPSQTLNLVIGPNGCGKTSLLEALYCLGRGRSFRTRNTDQLIRQGTEGFTLFSRLRSHDNIHRVGIQRSARQTRIRVDGGDVRSASELSERLPTKVIEAGLHAFFDQGPELRRRFLEWGMFHVEPHYLQAWSDYRRLLLQRNAALKTRWNDASLLQFDELLAEKGETIAHYRQAYLRDTQAYFASFCRDMGSAHFQALQIDIYRGWSKGLALIDALANSRESDRQRGFTQVGPHRTDLRIRINGMLARDFLSRGEQKLFIALLQIAQARFLFDRTGKRSLLLVDDLAAELDKKNRVLLLNALTASECQVFVTSTSDSALQAALQTPPLFHVEHGVVSQVV